MDMNPYVTFDGNCAEAFKFYEKLFGGKIKTMLKVADGPMASKMPDKLDQIMHAEINLGAKTLMGCDAMGPYEPAKGIKIQTAFDTVERAKEVFDALADGGKIMMPFEKTFFAEGFGLCDDRFGIPWIVVSNLSDEAHSA